MATIDTLSDDELLRYSRQMLLNDFDAAGQLRLKNSRVLVLGVGGLGSTTLLYLAAAGVGHLVISDPDTVDLSNLQRQVLHDTPALGRTKTASAVQRLRDLNPHARVTAFDRVLDAAELRAEAALADAVVVGTDNLNSRLQANLACWQTATPLIHAAAIGWEGQLSVFRPGQGDFPCLACLYGPEDEPEWDCATMGVMAPLVGILGSFQALETLKVVTGTGQPALGRLLLFDARRAEWQSISLPRQPGCRVCGQGSVTP